MKPGVFARTYASKDPVELFGRIRADGFSAVQFNLSCAGLAPLPTELPDHIPERIADAAREMRLSICALSGTYNMAHPDAANRRRNRVGFANVIRAAHDMGVLIVTLCTGSRDVSSMWRAHPENASSTAWSAFREELDFALELAEEFDVFLGIEPEPGNVIDSAKAARRILDEANSRHLGIILDAGNLLAPGEPARQRDTLAEAADLLGPNILLIHAKDVDVSGNVVPPGKGTVDLPSFVARMRAVGYHGPLVGHNFQETDAPEVAAYLSTVCRSD